MSPPLPPSPPSGPPRSTYFSRRNETHPFPPSPALTRILTLSTNMADTLPYATQSAKLRARLVSSFADRAETPHAHLHTTRCCHDGGFLAIPPLQSLSRSPGRSISVRQAGFDSWGCSCLWRRGKSANCPNCRRKDGGC